MKRSNWSRPEVLDYILDSYAGTEEGARGQVRRMFLWEDSSRQVWIGNSSAFAEHVAKRFGFPLRPYDYVLINKILLDVGERIKDPESRQPKYGQPQKPMVPVKRPTHQKPKRRAPMSRLE